MSAPPDSFRPLANRIIVRPDVPAERTKGGLFIPAQAKKATGTGIVLAIGPGMLCKDGERWPMPDIKPGDRVLYDERAPFPKTRFNEEDAIILRDDTVLAVLEDG